MTWRKWLYIISLIIFWGFLISGTLVKKEKISIKQLIADIKKNWIYYLLALWMPQAYIFLFTLQAIFDFKEFKSMIVNHYKKI